MCVSVPACMWYFRTKLPSPSKMNGEGLIVSDRVAHAPCSHTLQKTQLWNVPPKTDDWGLLTIVHYSCLLNHNITDQQCMKEKYWIYMLERPRLWCWISGMIPIPTRSTSGGAYNLKWFSTHTQLAKQVVRVEKLVGLPPQLKLLARFHYAWWRYYTCQLHSVQAHQTCASSCVCTCTHPLILNWQQNCRYFLSYQYSANTIEELLFTSPKSYFGYWAHFCNKYVSSTVQLIIWWRCFPIVTVARPSSCPTALTGRVYSEPD